MLQREIAVQKALQHPNVLRLMDVLETAKHFYLVIELATGGELFDLIQDHKRFTEDTARYYFHQLILGVRYCHKQGIVHRDLKPQNLLLTSDNQLKLADFGFSNFQQMSDDGKVTHTMRLQTCCGTPNYAAPEIFLGRGYSGFETDVWSCGVILYVMLVGHVPFKSDGKVKGLQGVIIAICEGRFSIPSALSDTARDLIRRIMTNDPQQRITIDDIIAHSWFAVGFDYSKVLGKDVPKMQVSEDMIRMSIAPVQEQGEADEDDGAILSPTAEAQAASWGPSEEQRPELLEALSDCEGDERVDASADGMFDEDASKGIFDQLPEQAGDFDAHGRSRDPGGCLRGAAGGNRVASVRFEGAPAAAGPAEAARTPHAFSKTILPCLCFYCGKFIYGQGMKCSRCTCPVHIKCVESAKEFTFCEQYSNRAKGGV
eukprot:TRINITY_DN3802_c3_g1_i1.p1 TRINITY_DN3802_c3_g1~~TRINITY_DN3802_c3_g1_i1.p1  ORF type:complete len:502 (+),score=157.83 TRINITY_DN3802_c3_g1_i1:221-1507(+)